MRLKDKVAFITGGGSGIGAASARHMANEGAKIAVVGIPAQGVEAVAASLREDDFEAIGIPTDVADEKQVQAAIAQTVDERLKNSIPLGRPATPEDIAPWVTFLCSDEARYANGAHFLIDGGMSA